MARMSSPAKQSDREPRLAAERGFDFLRNVRTAALWLLGPADWLYRRLRGHAGLPPLWLRRHAGPVGDFESAACDMEAILRQLQLVRTTDQILEIGCGCGAMLPAFGRMLGPEGRYVGFDVHPPSIVWCRRHFATDPRFRFELAEIASPYGDPSHQRTTQAYHFPLAGGSADFILAKSVFTHLLEEEARHYLREIRRTLRPGRLALITVFLFDGSGPAAVKPPGFPFPKGDSPMRWLRPLRPRAAIAFDRGFFEGMIAEAGLALREMVPGFWPGTALVPQGQDILILARSET
jgi:SAM-dependent methyltransferase